MAAKKKVSLLTSLAMIVLAGEAGGKAHEDVFADMANAGLVGVSDYNAETKIATVVATEAGKAQYQASLPPVFEIETDVEIPAISGRGRTSSASVYPFDKLEIGQSFFVPNSEKMENAAKSMNSTTSTANRRYAEPIPGEFKKIMRAGVEVEVPATRQTRKFICREVDETAKGRGPGARIWRVAVEA